MRMGGGGPRCPGPGGRTPPAPPRTGARPPRRTHAWARAYRCRRKEWRRARVRRRCASPDLPGEERHLEAHGEKDRRDLAIEMPRVAHRIAEVEPAGECLCKIRLHAGAYLLVDRLRDDVVTDRPGVVAALRPEARARAVGPRGQRCAHGLARPGEPLRHAEGIIERA